MAYGYSSGQAPYSGRTDPRIQSVANQPGGAARSNTGATADARQAQMGAPQFTSQTGSAVSPTGQITQTPAATGALAPGPQTMPGAYKPQQATQSPYGPYPATYSWQGSPVMDQMQGVVMNALATPLFSQDNINQMKGSAKDQAAIMQRDQLAQIKQNNAGRGTTGSGEEGADERRLAAAYGQQLTDNNRQIDLGTAQANRADMYQALGAGGAFTGQDEGLNQAAVASALGSYFQNRGLDIQKLLGLEGISAEREGNRLQAGTSILGSLLGYQNNNNQIGLGYSQLDAQQQNQLLTRLLGGF